MTDPEISKIIRSKRKSIALIVQRDGQLVVRAPQTISQKRILQFVQQQAEWISKQRQKMSQLPAHKNSHLFTEGEPFLFLGASYPLHIQDQQTSELLLTDQFLLARKYQPDAHRIFMKWYRRQAAAIFKERAQLLADQHNFSFQKLRITSARTRWGSCSSRGSINFSWRLIMAPLEVIDYVILHELVHTRIPNHSSTFWTNVESIDPNYRQKRLWLKQNGHLLTLD